MWHQVTVLCKSHQGQEEGRSGEDREKIEWKLSEVNTRAVSRKQNELIGKFSVTLDVFSIRG